MVKSGAMLFTSVRPVFVDGDADKKRAVHEIVVGPSVVVSCRDMTVPSGAARR